MVSYSTKYFLFSIIVILVSSFVSAEYCLQQQVNESKIGDGNCTLNYTGTYSFGENPSEPLFNGFIYINYSKPTNFSSALWNVKYGYNLTTGNPFLLNISIPTICANVFTDKIALRTYNFVRRYGYSGGNCDGTSFVQCYNGTDYETISPISTFSGGSGSCTSYDGSVTQYTPLDTDYSRGAFYKDCVNYPSCSFSYGSNGWFSDASYPSTLAYAVLYEESMFWNVSLNVSTPINITNCTEIWYAYYNPSTCTNGSQLKYYIDLNNCNTTTTLPVDNGTITNCTITQACANQLCLDPIYANTTCCIVTPTIYCSGNYDYYLYDNNGLQIEHNNLTIFNQADNSYFYYFTKDIGTYYTRICDDSTRQINVVARDEMLSIFDWTLIILFIFLLVTIYLGIRIYPIMFGASALITAFMGAILYYASYPTILVGVCGILVMFFVVLALFGRTANN